MKTFYKTYLNCKIIFIKLYIHLNLLHQCNIIRDFKPVIGVSIEIMKLRANYVIRKKVWFCIIKA